MTPSGATYKGVLQLEATFIEVKNIYLHRDLNPGPWNARTRVRVLVEKHVFHINKSCLQLEDTLASGSRRSPNLG